MPRDTERGGSPLFWPIRFNEDFRLTARERGSKFPFPEVGVDTSLSDKMAGVNCQDSGLSPPASGPIGSRPQH